MHPCLTPVLTSKASEVPSAVRTQHLVSVYSSPTRFTSWLGTPYDLSTAIKAARSTES